MQPMKTVAIKKFLEAKTHADLAALYHFGMEVQVNVAQGDGTRIVSEYKGKKSQGWTDGVTTWKPFRIPYNAYSSPEYTDTEMSYDLEKRVEGIGLTGWDWQNRKSIYVAFDFDAITGHSEKHSKKLSDIELKEIRDSVSNVGWVTVRYSTGGNGLHLYVTLETPETTNTHTEHAALARAILGKISAVTGQDLQTKVDAVGSNMWIYHRKMVGTQGLSIIKEGIPLDHVPENWREHIDVVSGRRKRTLPQFIDKDTPEAEKIFEELTNQRTRTKLDDEHKKLIAFVEASDFNSWYDTDHAMLVTHTLALKQAHDKFGYRGVYDTISTGKDATHNCFCYPMRDGAWVVRRYTRGVGEHASWSQDANNGMTRCFLNRQPELKIVCQALGGLENPKGGHTFPNAETAANALRNVGIDLGITAKFSGRVTKVKQTKDNKVIVEMEKEASDTNGEMKDWILEGRKWTRVFKNNSPPPTEAEVGNYDDVIRHIVDMEHADCGWTMQTEGKWRTEPISHISLFLQSLGVERDQVNTVLGSCVTRCWTLVNRPFEPTYPGDRQWNKNSPQFVYPPTENLDNLNYPTWTSVLAHCGSGLDDHLANNEWARTNGITTGADYLKCWIASVFQKPEEPLPYLFFYNREQNTGKSLFHEALSELVTGGIVRADQALTHETFNGELQGAVVCIIEETNVNDTKNKRAYNKIKDWVTSRTIQVRNLYESPRTIVNTTHWVQCSNDPDGVPIFPGDTRIVMLHVPALDPDKIVAKRVMIERLRKEAPDFLAEILNLEIPTCNDRLNIPIIDTPDKKQASEGNMTAVELFIYEKMYDAPGQYVLYSELYNKFMEWVDSSESSHWTKQKMGKAIDSRKYPKGRLRGNPNWHIGNLSFTKPETAGPHRYRLVIDTLELDLRGKK
jgi:hypothetical protein